MDSALDHNSSPPPSDDSTRKAWCQRGEVDAVADRNGGVKIVERQRSLDLALAFALNYREMLGSCRLLQFTFPVDIPKVEADGVRVPAEWEALGVRLMQAPDPERTPSRLLARLRPS